MKDGFFLLHRKFLDNPLLNIKPFCKGYAWVTILALTNHKEGFIRVKNGTLIKIERGECGYSEKALADLFGWSRGKVRRFLEQLKLDGMIQQKNVEDRTIIVISNYEAYQTVHQKNEKTDSKRYTKRTQTNNDNKDNSNTSYINSLSHVTKDEREILNNYVKKNKLAKSSVRAYVNTMIRNGDHLAIIEEEQQKQAKRQEVKQKEEKTEILIDTEEDKKKIKEIQESIKRQRRKGLTNEGTNYKN